MNNKPKHYSEQGIDTFARMEANCTKEEILGFIKGNIDKYNFRSKGQDIEDFNKIIAYANWGKNILEKEIYNQEEGELPLADLLNFNRVHTNI